MNITVPAPCFRSIFWKRCDAVRSFQFKAIGFLTSHADKASATDDSSHEVDG